MEILGVDVLLCAEGHCSFLVAVRALFHDESCCVGHHRDSLQLHLPVSMGW